jgi:hypothetical protein
MKMIKDVILYSIISMFLLGSCQTTTDEKEYDTRAIASLDAMSDAIGKLNSCSYTLNTIIQNGTGTELLIDHDVYMRGPNKMYIHSQGSKGQRGYWYNGNQLAYFSYKTNEFDTVSAPENILAAIDFLHNKFAIDFPAADFFYPSFTDDIMANYDKVFLVGDDQVDGVDCTSILASNNTETIQIWIDKSTNLPYQLNIESKDNYYEAVFSNWILNPHLPDLLFEFEPPVNATRKNLETKK